MFDVLMIMIIYSKFVATDNYSLCKRLFLADEMRGFITSIIKKFYRCINTITIKPKVMIYWIVVLYINISLLFYWWILK